MSYWLMAFALLCWPKHRGTARLAIAEGLIKLVYRVLPDGPERIEFAQFLVTSRWFTDLSRQATREPR